MDIRRFTVRVPDEVLEDLRERLSRTRWPDQIAGPGWTYGADLDYLKELTDYWRNGFDWRKQERAINAFLNYRATVEGVGIHFIYERGKGPNPMPLLITHGWPSSFVEMLKIIPMLTDPANHGGGPEDSFDVVVPSMPGYGFSDRPDRPGMNVGKISDLFAKLMLQGLGYSRFAARGGDIGSSVSTLLALDHPDRLIGIHLTDVFSPTLGEGARELTPAERAFLEEEERWEREEGAYGEIQATRPQTLSYGLNDSPAGLAAWIVEKFRGWSDCGGDVERCFTKDELLTNLTIYWATQTINSSVRLYYESRHNPRRVGPGERIEPPAAIALFPKDLSSPPREWAERLYNVQRWTRMPKGGHFAALEQPELLVTDIREFFRPLR
ncbi:MAG TPA: epoxide hydrolase [Blastocatellia bacterium]|nr:epoxide hydrolase [Blastocatellia bacterium]